MSQLIMQHQVKNVASNFTLFSKGIKNNKSINKLISYVVSLDCNEKI